MSDLYNVLAVVTIGDTRDSVDKLVSTLKLISHRYGENKGDVIDVDYSFPDIPPLAISPRDAFYSTKRVVLLEDSIGEICAEIVMAYPPGIPIICQGEVITKRIVTYINKLKESELDVQGTEDAEVNFIKVIDVKTPLQVVINA
jgi:arginine/lysine/ornithine decarboxylase